jgi:hypothetical protein
VFRTKNASAFAQFLYRADAGARGAQEISFEDCRRRSGNVFGRDFLYETRDVDVRGTSVRTGSVKTEQAAIGFNRRLVIA